MSATWFALVTRLVTHERASCFRLGCNAIKTNAVGIVNISTFDRQRILQRLYAYSLSDVTAVLQDQLSVKDDSGSDDTINSNQSQDSGKGASEADPSEQPKPNSKSIMTSRQMKFTSIYMYMYL